MKTQIRYFSAIALLMAILCGCTGTNNQEKLLAIQDYRILEEPTINLEFHKSGDVDIYRAILMGEGYKVVFYSDVTGDLLSHRAFYGTEEDFDHAEYEWKNDTTVIVRLINSENAKETSFEVFGNASTTGMTIDE